MKFTIRLYLYWVSIFLTFFMGVVLVVYFLWGVWGDLLQMGLVFFIVGMIPPAILTLFLAKRLDYMESDDTNPPSFSGQKTELFHFKGRTEQPFDEVMQRVDRQWIISYSDRKKGILKFRTDARMAAWGLGGYMKMEDKESILVIVYPIRPRSKRERLMVEQLLLLMKSVLGCAESPRNT
ncbi:MAG: hypothetical protein VB074_05230 [Proteiniphilum sp.]|jgi:hypothetical protein|uniref:hypothetical protein n=1 Tax=Proteiniphilum sp. TaxID=1926877 RepID=UPI00092AD787|nr:hypothetical protein [Proteiniphilum sp.]MEA5127565.1 hypothetical protein [Proteiniphilum sp.]OJV88011.1 MAG: hypothetical protein BGO34_13560 [Bacteroidia bacterium 44-10]